MSCQWLGQSLGIKTFESLIDRFHLDRHPYDWVSFAGQHRHDGAIKRGGEAALVDAEEAMAVADGRTLPPDAEFDRAWACAVLDRTLTLLQEEHQRAGKAEVFSMLKPWLAGAASAAARLGVSQTAVRVLLSRLRKRMRELLRAELAQTLDEGGDVDAEMRHLADVLAGG